MSDWKIGGCCVGVVVLLVVLAFGLELGGLKWQGFFAKEKANIERGVFKEGNSHQEGMARDLAQYKFQYNQAKDEDEKAGIAALIRDSFADFDPKDLKSDSLHVFLNDIMEGNL